MPRLRHAVAGITVAIFFTMMGGGLLGSLIGVRAKGAGISAGVMGIASAMYYLGFVAGMPVMGRALERLTRRAMFAASATIMGMAAAAYGLAVAPVAWLLLRVASGFSLAGCYLVVETWLHDQTPNDVRGRVMGLYVAMAAGGLVAGQLVLGLTDPSSWIPFAISGAISAVSWIPLLFVVDGAATRHSREGMMRFRDVARAVPSGVIGYLLVGVTQGCLLTMASVYAARADLGTRQVGIYVGAITTGAVAMQIPVGAIADRMSRRLVMVVLCAVTALLCGVSMMVTAGSVSSYALAFVIGGCSSPLYALGNAYTHDWLPQGQVVAASSALLVTYSVGAVFGPLLAAAAMTAFGVRGFFWALIVGHGALALFMGYQMVVAPDRSTRIAGVD